MVITRMVCASLLHPVVVRVRAATSYCSSPLLLLNRKGQGAHYIGADFSNSIHFQAKGPLPFYPFRRAIMAHARRGFPAEIKKMKRQDDDFASDLEYESPLDIVEYPDPRLRAKNKRIMKFDDKLKQLVDEMFDLMYKTDGVGLSAPQVGVNAQLMVFNPAGERGKGEEIVLVNPKIYKYSKKTEVFLEGCLSFPEIYADVERPLTVKIEARDISGKKFTLRLEEFHSRIFQHEYDHLQGILFFERMQPEILETIRLKLQTLEQKYEIKTGMPAPERVKAPS